MKKSIIQGNEGFGLLTIIQERDSSRFQILSGYEYSRQGHK
jgi:hypothetical protein